MLVPKTSSGGIGMKRWTTKRTVVTVTVGLAMLLALGLIFGCGGSTQAPTPSASPSSEAATLQAYFDAMQPVLVNVEHATDVLLNTIYDPKAKPGNAEWRREIPLLRIASAMLSDAAVSFAAIDAPPRLRNAQRGLVRATRTWADRVYHDAEMMRLNVPLAQWETERESVRNATIIQNGQSEWKLRVQAESKRLHVAIPFRDLYLFRTRWQ